MMEALETRRELIFPLAWSGRGQRRLVPCAVTGPTCDSEDTLFFDVPLPADLGAGDRLYIRTAGAYTTAYASRFNGFDVPRTHVVAAGGPSLRPRALAAPGAPSPGRRVAEARGPRRPGLRLPGGLAAIGRRSRGPRAARPRSGRRRSRRARSSRVRGAGPRQGHR